MHVPAFVEACVSLVEVRIHASFGGLLFLSLSLGREKQLYKTRDARVRVERPSEGREQRPLFRHLTPPQTADSVIHTPKEGLFFKGTDIWPWPFPGGQISASSYTH